LYVLPIPAPVRDRLKNKIAMINNIGWRWLLFPLSALVVATLLHSGALLRHFHDASEKTALLISGPRTDVGDNYYYFSMLRHAPERMQPKQVRLGDPDGGDQRNVNPVSDAYAAALYVGHALYRVAAAFTATSREAVLLTSILNTAFLAFCFAAFLATLLGGALRSRWFFVLVIAYVGMVFVDAFGNSLYFGRLYWANNLLTYYSNALRLVNPALFWAAGMGAAAFIVRFIRGERTGDFLAAVALAGLTGLFSISVGATLALALGLAIALEALRNRTIHWRLVGIALAATAGLAWSYLQLNAYTSTPLGQELRHGEFLGINPKWHFLLLMGLIPFVWRTLDKDRVFVAALVVSTMIVGMFCESFHLGSRLWLRGAVVYAWAIVVFVVVRIALRRLASGKGAGRSRLRWQAAAVVSMIVFVYQAQKPDVGSWKGFIEREKWELLDWMDQHLTGGSVVASGDIEDVFLLPIYTRAKPLYAMYGLTNRSLDDELRRYFYTMRLFGRDRQILDSVLSLRQEDATGYVKYVMGRVPAPVKGDAADAIIFLELVVYHAYVNTFSNALVDPMQHQLLERLLRSRAEEASKLSYSFDYAIVESGKPPPLGLLGWPVVFRSSRYFILQSPLAPKSHD
jgi:hypothetical protein